MLEPCDGKLSRTVLRGEGSRKAPDLPGMTVESLALLVRKLAASELQWANFCYAVEDLSPNVAFRTATAQHPVPVTLHEPMHLLQGPDVAGDAVVGKVATQNLVEVADLLPHRPVPH